MKMDIQIHLPQTKGLNMITLSIGLIINDAEWKHFIPRCEFVEMLKNGWRGY